MCADLLQDRPFGTTGSGGLPIRSGTPMTMSSKVNHLARTQGVFPDLGDVAGFGGDRKCAIILKLNHLGRQ